MSTPQRRRSDRAPSAPGQDTRNVQQWVLQCASRIVEIEPHLSIDEATEIARSMGAFERTGAMTPEAAAEFVAQEMRQSGSARFERRSATSPARR